MIRSSDGKGYYSVSRPNPLVSDDWGLRSDVLIENGGEIGETDVTTNSKFVNARNKRLPVEPPAVTQAIPASVVPVSTPPTQPKTSSQSVGKLWGAKESRERRSAMKPASDDPLYGGLFTSDTEEDL